LAPIAEGGARDGGESDGADSIVAKMRREAAAITDQNQPHHLELKAMLYVRQSSAHKVHEDFFADFLPEIFLRV
jgi:hypothetical protein